MATTPTSPSDVAIPAVGKPLDGVPEELGAPARWPAVGQWNVLEASIGKRGMGKSTHQAARALQLQQESGGYVIGHSLGQRLPDRLPKELGGAKLDIRYHQTIAELEKGLQRRPRDWHILSPQLPEEGGPPNPDTADDLMRWSIRLSKALRDKAWWDENPYRLSKPKSVNYTGLHVPPIIVILDEGIAVDAASTGDSATGKNKWFLQYVYSIRHLHIALLYAIQEPTSRSWRVLESATAVHCFRIDHEWAVNAVRAAGANAEQADRIKRLPPYEFVTLR